MRTQPILRLPAILGIILVQIAISKPAIDSTHTTPYQVSSGVFSALPDAQSDQLVWQQTINSKGSPWMYLLFGNCSFGQGSFLEIRSPINGSRQVLDSVGLEQWQHQSAYFPGEVVVTCPQWSCQCQSWI
jgi:hypothetical protein